MEVREYLRKSEAAQAMARFCDQHKFGYAIGAPGSKGHPFFVVSAKGEIVARVPFSSTPSDSRRGHLNAVTDLKKALRSKGINFTEEEKPVKTKTPYRPMPKDGEGCPLATSAVRLTKRGTLTPGPIGPNVEYAKQRDSYIERAIKRGKALDSIAQHLTSGGVVHTKQLVVNRAYALRRAGRLPNDWMPSAQPKPDAHNNAPARQEVLVNTDRKVTTDTNSIFEGALRKEREVSREKADAMAAHWIEQIASARKKVEIEHVTRDYDGRYTGVLEILTA